MGGGSWENNQISASLMPASALSADNRLKTVLDKITATPEGGKLFGILQPVWTKVVESDMRTKWLGDMLRKELVVRDLQYFGGNMNDKLRVESSNS